jgi:soluble lytic murein transglycosylase-like protein
MDISTIEARKALAGKWAAKYGLDPAIVCAVADHETGGTWDPYTSRTEEGFYHRYIVNPDGTYKITIPLDSIRSRDTEAKHRSTSWGLMQIMGQTARELGYTARYLNSLCDPDAGMDVGCRKLQKCFNRHPGDAAAALQEYNGGSNPQYASQVLARVPVYQ